MAYSYPVKWMNSAMRNAPGIDGSTGGGGYLAALYAFLITGWGSVAATSVSVSGGVGTATFAAGATFDYYSVVLIEGATAPSLLNGEARVLSSAAGTITFETDAPDGTATGAITFKFAPVGNWERVFNGTNKAVFRSLDPQSSKFCVRIDDTGGLSARVRGYESMTDIDAGTNPFPTEAQISGGGYHGKSIAASTAKVQYHLLGDSRFYHFGVAAGIPNGSTLTSTPLRGFGDLIALNPAGDPYAVALSSAAAETVGASINFSYGTFDQSQSSNSAIFVAREMSGAAGAKLLGSIAYVGSVNTVSGGNGALGAFPSSVDGQLKYSRRYVVATDGVTPRANIPGVLTIPQSGVISTIKHGDLVVGAGSMAGRLLLALSANLNSASGAPIGIVLLDVTGPWR